MPRLFRVRILVLAALLLATRPIAMQSYPTKFSAAVAERADVKQALAFIDERFDSQVTEWISVTEIPAQSTHEEKRAAYVKSELEKIGLTATIDGIGNVMARRPGTGGGPTVVFAAHMDTVHPMDANLEVTRKPDNTLHAPGVGDNSASVVDLLQAARALNAARVRTDGDLIFLFTVQEELGLKGMYYWIDRNPKTADMIVAVDGALGPVNYGALGIYWSKMTFTAEGSHTNSSRGKPNPARAAAQCITDIYTIPLPDSGRAGWRHLQRRRHDDRRQRRQRHPAGGHVHGRSADGRCGPAEVAGLGHRRQVRSGRRGAGGDVRA